MDIENLTGHMVNGYTIKNPLNTTSGEAVLYICQKDDKEYVFKIYREEDSLKQNVIDVLLKNPSKNLAKLYEVGTYDDKTYEIMEYYKEGSLHGHTFTYDEMRTKIIPGINQALYELHTKADIVHRDLKPSNLMLNGDDIVLIDFGVSSILEGEEAVATRSGITHIYSAPECIIGNVSLKISDYYSFGVIIYELFTGEHPSAEMPEDADPKKMANLNLNTRFKMPDDMPGKLKELIWGLTYKEIGTKEEDPTQYVRWSYEEVCRWIDEANAEGATGEVDETDEKPMPSSAPGLHWKAHHYESLDKLAGRLYEALLLDDDVCDTSYGPISEFAELFKLGLISEFVRKEMPGRKSAIIRAQQIEEEFQSGNTQVSRETIIDIFLLVFTMVSMSVLEFEGQQFTTIDEFVRYLEDKILTSSFTDLNTFCHKLWDGKEMAINVEAFFIAEGGQKELEKLKAIKL